MTNLYDNLYNNNTEGCDCMDKQIQEKYYELQQENKRLKEEIEKTSKRIKDLIESFSKK